MYPSPNQGQGGYPPQPGYPQTMPGQSQFGDPSAGYPAQPMPPQGQFGNAGPSYPPNTMPAESGFENPGAAPSAPPASMFDSMAGYENTTYGQGYAAPPPTAPPMPQQQRPDEEFLRAADISAEEAQDAMGDFVGAHCCYGKSPAKEMVIGNIKPSSAYHYELTSFTESRSTAWQVEAYNGQAVDGPGNGYPPGPWDIDVSPTEMFSSGSAKVEIPHTASVKPCHYCFGVGHRQCTLCFGRGRRQCVFCHGRGLKREFEEERLCSPCQGTGQQRCHSCHGTGRTTCHVCHGCGRVKTFIELTVSWKNHDSEKVIERSQGGPKDKVKKASGIEIFQQKLPRVWPIATFFETEINTASQQFVNEHSSAWPQERILMQKHVLRAIPVSEVSYSWKSKDYRFWVYGTDPHKVFAPDYPQKCCCGCVIL